MHLLLLQYYLVLVLDLYQELKYLSFVLSISTDELLSTSKITTFLIKSKFGNEKK